MNERYSKRPSIPDFLVGFLFLVISIIPVLALSRDKDTGYEIYHDNELIHRGDLGRDTLIVIELADGLAKIEVSDGKIAIRENTCPHRYCMKLGWTDRSSKPIVCIPNRIVIQVKAPDELDGQLR